MTSDEFENIFISGPFSWNHSLELREKVYLNKPLLKN
jgi:hypothetical protein